MKNRIQETFDKYKEECTLKIYNYSDIINYIDDMHSIYMIKESNKERDVIFATILIRVVNSSILNIIYLRENIDVIKENESLNVV